ncbi:hypothetical protein ACLB1T_00995 [Escherichia coli]
MLNGNRLPICWQVIGVGSALAVGGCSGNGDLPCLFQYLNCPLNTLSTNTGEAYRSVIEI